MKFIQHRVNQLSLLNLINPILGCEIDLRTDVSSPSTIHLSHDAWSRGDNLVDWLDLYKKKNFTGTVIFNTKEDGLEDEVLKLTKQFEIKDFFFLDTTFPTFIKFTNQGLGDHFSCRVSKYESLDSVLQFSNNVAWAWVDCFEGIPLSESAVERISNSFKICLVSPELQKVSENEIKNFQHLKKWSHSVCTKRADLW